MSERLREQGFVLDDQDAEHGLPPRNRLDSLPKMARRESGKEEFAANDSEGAASRRQAGGSDAHHPFDHGHAFAAEDHAVAVEARGEMTAALARLIGGEA